MLSANDYFVAAILDSLGIIESNVPPGLKAYYSVI
jgi:hypothetical protein